MLCYSIIKFLKIRTLEENMMFDISVLVFANVALSAIAIVSAAVAYAILFIIIIGTIRANLKLRKAEGHYYKRIRTVHHPRVMSFLTASSLMFISALLATTINAVIYFSQ